MSLDRSVEQRISAWLEAEAPDQLPDVVLQAALDRSHATRQRRSLGAWRTFLVPQNRMLIAGGATAIAIFAIGALFLASPRQPIVGPGLTPTAAPSPTPTATASATLSPVSLPGQMAFSWQVDGNTDVYLMNLDRTGLVRLTTDPAEDVVAGWSPDGATLLFTRRTDLDPETSELFAVDVESGDETQLTSRGGAIGGGQYSPAGDVIEFEAWPSNPGLYVMEPSGANPRLFHPSTTDQDYPRGWSADGRYFLVLHADTDIYRIDVATGETADVLADGTAHRDALFSPDGTRLAWVGDARSGIVVAAPDGTNPQALGYGVEAGYIAWSPDGQYLAYRDPDGWIHLLRADGSEHAKWAPGFAPAFRPTP